MIMHKSQEQLQKEHISAELRAPTLAPAAISESKRA